MKRIAGLSLLLVALLVLSLFGCGNSYAGDGRIGNYIAYGPDGETVTYRLELYENGEGKMVHYPAIGGETSEEIIFTFEDENLVLHGTEPVGGVIGRNEFLGKATQDGSKYTVELRSVAAGTPLATFVQE